MPLLPSIEIAKKPTPAANRTIRVCDAQILMAHPFFNLAKAPRLKPIDYKSGVSLVQVEASNSLGIATIWDADILI